MRGPALPRPAHVVVVVEENKSFWQIDGNKSAPAINALMKRGAVFTNSHGVTHPSLPNYFALFAGLTNDNGDGCPATGIAKNAPNLASEMLATGHSFAAYSEALPEAGWTGCAAGTYGRKHAPWVHFSNVPSALHRPLSALKSFDTLPTLTFVIPDVEDDMHSGSIARGDDWFAKHVSPLVAWAYAHDALVVLTWDEGLDAQNHVATMFAGPMVRPGKYDEFVDHYRVLRTLEDMYGLAPAGRSKAVQPISDCWQSGAVGFLGP